VSNIVLRNLEKTESIVNSVKLGYLYKDVAFDLEMAYTPSGEFEKKYDQKDLKPSYDKEAVLTALKNLFTTTPGQKLLNPQFGIDLRRFLFDPVSETRAFIIGNKIYENVSNQEPRVEIQDIQVTAMIDDQEYIIDLNLSVPTLNLYGVSLTSSLNTDGFTITDAN